MGLEALSNRDENNEAVVRSAQALEFIDQLKAKGIKEIVLDTSGNLLEVNQLAAKITNPEQIGKMEILHLDDFDTQTKLADALSTHKVSVRRNEEGVLQAYGSTRGGEYQIL